MTNTPAISSDRLLSWKDVRNRVPLSRVTVWTLRRQGSFPKPLRISPNRVAWRERDIHQWIEDRAAQ